jgi:hypothetical protein
MTNIRDQVGDLTEFTPGNAVARAQLDREIERLSRWNGQLRELAKEVSSMDCFYIGSSCPPDCQCLSARAGRLAHSAGLKP